MKRRTQHRLLAAAAALALLLGLEVTLAFVGVGGVDTYAGGGPGAGGFDPEAAYFVPSLRARGGWRTRYMKGPGQRDVDIPPKGARPRAIVVGASTARGYGSQALEAQLVDALGATAPKVLNLGRYGYGTDRLVLVLEQALARLEPDLVVFCGGDNEFIEVPPAERTGAETPAAFIRRWRTFNTLLALFGERDIWDDLRPEEFVRYSEQRRGELTFADTLAGAERLRRNLRRACGLARGAGARLVLCTLVYNRLAAPFSSRLPDELSPAAAAELERCRAAAQSGLPAFLAPLLPANMRTRITAGDWWEHAPPRVGVSGDLPGRRPALGALADQDPLEGEHPGRWGERVWTLHRALERFHARDLGADEVAGLERAERELRRALELCPDHPESHFELGLVSYLLRRDPRATLAHLELAAEYDRAPRKSCARINGVIRDVAAEFPEVLLYDADAYFSSLMPDGLVGWEWMLDYCHLRYGAYEVLRADLARALAERWPPGRGAR
jgi:lysophospholipase L1-like esterase